MYPLYHIERLTQQNLTQSAIRGKMLVALGVRLAVGQQTLDLLAEVRILHPQPTLP